MVGTSTPNSCALTTGRPAQFQTSDAGQKNLDAWMNTVFWHLNIDKFGHVQGKKLGKIDSRLVLIHRGDFAIAHAEASIWKSSFYWHFWHFLRSCFWVGMWSEVKITSIFVISDLESPQGPNFSQIRGNRNFASPHPTRVPSSAAKQTNAAKSATSCGCQP